MRKRGARFHPSKKTLTPKQWAGRVLNNCSRGLIDLNHPDAIKAAKIVGHKTAMKIISQKHKDALNRRLPGSFENKNRK